MKVPADGRVLRAIRAPAEGAVAGLKSVTDLGTPVVIYDRQLTGDDTSTGIVLCDNMAATRQPTEHLVFLGHGAGLAEHEVATLLALPEVPSALVVANNLMSVRGARRNPSRGPAGAGRREPAGIALAPGDDSPCSRRGGGDRRHDPPAGAPRGRDGACKLVLPLEFRVRESS